VSLAFDAAMILGPIIKSFIGTGHLEANQIVQLQNSFHQKVLAPAVAAKDNPNTSLEDLIYWRDGVRSEGEAFYHFTEKFAAAGPGARRTMFGEQDATGNWIATGNALGIATQILNGFNQVIYQRTGDPTMQLGIDWGKIVQIGVDTAANIFDRPVYVGSGTTPPFTGIPPSQRLPPYTGGYAGAAAMPSWVLPAGIALLAVLLLKKK
jgi:hypothetical protein